MNELTKARHALNTLEHRGRDQWSEWYDHNVYFGHRRLSIIDLSENGKQPFASRNTITVVNGEIYNFQNLKKIIGEHLFISNSDSEVIHHGYQTWGINGLLDRLDGMYAFAIFDRKKQELILSKDKWGKKPLFYAKYQDQFIFSSEIKAILDFIPALRVFSFSGIKNWISFRGSHANNTIYHGIYRLPPGSYLHIDKNLKIQEVRYYNLISKAINKSELSLSTDQLIEILDNKLSAAIEKRLISDVPLGLQLSGGIDSSLIAAYMHEKTGSELHTFSVGFSEQEYRNYSEAEYSNFVSKKWNYTHHAFGINKEMIGDNFERVLYIFDGMLDYPNAIPLYLLNKFSKQFISVSLTGEAADELFGGYRKFLQINKLKSKNISSHIIPDFIFNFNLNNAINKRFLRPLYLNKNYGGNLRKTLEAFNSYISPETIRYLFGGQEDGLLDDEDFRLLSDLSPMRQALLVDHMTYLYSLLDRQDRTSMGANIEARLPFIDQDLVEWIIRLNTNLLINKNENKIPLKQMSAHIYGNDFTYRKKMGFPLPLEGWLTNKKCFGKYYAKIFDDDFLLYTYLDKKELMRFLNRKTFSNKLINYTDSEVMWLKWFLMVLRATQDVFQISDIKD